MYCGYCGKKNSDHMLFCVFCGKPLEMPEQEEGEDGLRKRYGRPKTDEKEGKSSSAQAPSERTGAAETVAPGRASDFAKPLSAPQDEAEAPPNLPLEPAIRIKANYRARRRPRHAPRETAEPILPSAPVLKAPLEMRAQRPPERKRDLSQREEEVFDAPEPPRATPLPKPILSKPVELTGTRPPRLQRTDAPVRPVNFSNVRQANTIIPRHDPEMDDLFFETEDFAQDFDEPEASSREYLYEEPERQGFFYRHIRGIVALILLALTVAIVGYWLGFGSGQRVLGQLYLSSNPQTYLSLGGEAEARGAYEEAGAYYLKALEISPAVETAIKASNAYVQADNLGKAAVALETLISISPDYTDAYVTLKTFYPDPATRPARITELLQQGYLRTGDERLRAE